MQMMGRTPILRARGSRSRSFPFADLSGNRPVRPSDAGNERQLILRARGTAAALFPFADLSGERPVHPSDADNERQLILQARGSHSRSFSSSPTFPENAPPARAMQMMSVSSSCKLGRGFFGFADSPRFSHKQSL